FRIYFTPLPGYFSPFPHGTCPLSVTREYLGLAGGPARFTRDFSSPVLLGNTPRESASFRLRGSHPLCRAIQDSSTMTQIYHSRPGCQSRNEGPTTPHLQRLTAITQVRFGLIRFRSPLLTESQLFSLPVGTEMF